MNSNFDNMNNGMSPVGGIPNPVPNNINPMTNNVVNPNVNVVPTNPTYVDNSMVNNNINPINSVPPVVDNTIASVDNNITDDNKKKPNKLVTLFLLVLAVGVGILAMNTDSLFFDNTKPDLIDEANYEQGVKDYIARKDEEKEMYHLYKTTKDGVVVMLSSKFKSDYIARPEYQEKYKFSKDVKLYTYNCIYKYDENDERIPIESVAKFDMKDIDYLIKYNDGRAPAVYIERKGNKIVQMVMYIPHDLSNYFD